MAAKNLKMAIVLGLCNEEQEQGVTNEVRDFLAHAHGRYINQLRKAGKPYETADYQIREFLEEILADINAFKTEEKSYTKKLWPFVEES